jgi:hypothetical protein
VVVFTTYLDLTAVFFLDKNYKDPGDCLSPTYISNWLSSELQHLAMVSHQYAMAYDTRREERCEEFSWNGVFSLKRIDCCRMSDTCNAHQSLQNPSTSSIARSAEPNQTPWWWPIVGFWRMICAQTLYACHSIFLAKYLAKYLESVPIYLYVLVSHKHKWVKCKILPKY